MMFARRGIAVSIPATSNR